jgi:hypothetical protein
VTEDAYYGDLYLVERMFAPLHMGNVMDITMVAASLGHTGTFRLGNIDARLETMIMMQISGSLAGNIKLRLSVYNETGPERLYDIEILKVPLRDIGDDLRDYEIAFKVVAEVGVEICSRCGWERGTKDGCCNTGTRIEETCF